MQYEKLLTSSTPAKHRAFLTAALRYLRQERGARTVSIPCCGNFELAACAIMAGFKPDQIIASDTQLYGIVMGYLYSGRSLEELDLRKGEGWDKCHSEIDRAAHLIWLMMYEKLDPGIPFEAGIRAELDYKPGPYKQKLLDRLVKSREFFAGLGFKVADVQGMVEVPHGVTVINPHSKLGTKSWSKLAEALAFKVPASGFLDDDAYNQLYAASKEQAEPFFWIKHEERNTETKITEFGEDVVFGVEKTAERQSYWLCTKPEELEGWKYKNRLVWAKRQVYRPFDAPTWSEDDVLTEDSKITFVKVPVEVAYYYRGLFVHKLGAVSAEVYVLMLIDGKVFATVGLFFRDLLLMNTDRLYETFGSTSRIRGHRSPTKLLMLCITTTAFRDFASSLVTRMNRIYKMRGLRTTCLSKYRKVKHNTKIFNLLNRERLDNGIYKITYDVEFRQETFAEALGRYLREEEETKKAREKANTKEEVRV